MLKENILLLDFKLNKYGNKLFYTGKQRFGEPCFKKRCVVRGSIIFPSFQTKIEGRRSFDADEN